MVVLVALVEALTELLSWADVLVETFAEVLTEALTEALADVLAMIVTLIAGTGLVGPNAGMGLTRPAGATRGAMVMAKEQAIRAARTVRLEKYLINKFMAS